MHDGKLDADTEPKNHAEVEMLTDSGEKFISIHGGYGLYEERSVYLSPGQALSLLAWLEQERETLEKLAKEEEGNG